MLKVNDLLKLDQIKELKIIAGHSGLEKEIFNVNIIENPDSYNWFTAGDFILTTGYVFKDNQEDQKKLILELVDQNAAGLGIKTKRYWDTVPKEMIELANEHGLAIIEIPYNYSLAEVMNAINIVLFERENSTLNKYRAIYNAYRQVQIDGGSYNEIMEISSNLVNNSLLFLDDNFQLLSYYENILNNKPLANYLKLNINELSFDYEFTSDLPNDPNKLSLSIKKTFSKNSD